MKSEMSDAACSMEATYVVELEETWVCPRRQAPAENCFSVASLPLEKQEQRKKIEEGVTRDAEQICDV